MMTIKERIERYKEKHPIPTKNYNFGPSAYVPMYYAEEIKTKNGKKSYDTRHKHFGNYSCGSAPDWSAKALPPKCVYGMMFDIDEFVGFIRMYEIKADVPDLRETPNMKNAYYETNICWEKADFEIYIEISTHKIYDKNGNPVRKSDKIFPRVKTKIDETYYHRVVSTRRSLVAFKEMEQIYYPEVGPIADELEEAGYDVSHWGDKGKAFERMMQYLLSTPRFNHDYRTKIEKRSAFCLSWVSANIYKQTDGTHVYKIPEQYNGENVYQIIFNDSYRIPVLYIIGKEYCIFSSMYKNKLRINDLPGRNSFLKAEELSVFAGDPEIGWASKIADGSEAVTLVKSISNVFYDQLFKMGLNNFLRAHMLVCKGYRKTGSVLKYYGMTKKQAEVVDNYLGTTGRFFGAYSAEAMFKAISAYFSLSSISDEKDFETIFGYMHKNSRWHWDDIRVVFSTKDYSYTAANATTKAERSIIMEQKKKLLKMVAETSGRVPYDLVSMYTENAYYEQTGYTQRSLYSNGTFVPKSFWLELMPTIHSYQDVVRQHDFYMVKCRENQEELDRKRDEERQKFFADLEEGNKKRQKKWEFSGEKFSIVFPMKLSDVKQEGASLNHCVGGYAERHLKNETTILFLRKNESIDTSFYTIELRSADYRRYSVVQVHGACNKWVGNDPDAAVFLYRYFKSHNVSCDNKILLRTSGGYCGDNTNMLDESILTDED